MTAEELLAVMRADGAETPVKVETKRWGTLYVRAPNVAEFEKLRKNWRTGQEDDGDGEDSNRALMAAHYICDEHGKRILDPENPEHIATLAARRGDELTEVLNAALGDAQGNLAGAKSS